MPGQAWLFLSTLIAGMAIGLFYDFFRIARKVIPHAGWVVQLQDLLFWVAATIGVFYFMLLRNFGEIRMFAILGVVIGAVLYFYTISKPVLKVSVTVVNFIKRVISTAIHIITTPIRFIFNLLNPPIKKLATKQHKHLRQVARYGKIQVKKQIRNWEILRKKV